jgi:hypothetical protein
MAVSDYQNGSVITTVPIGTGVDGAGYDATSGNVLASNAGGTLTVIHQDSPNQYHVAQTVETPRRSRNIGLDPTNHRLYVASGKFGPTPPGSRRGPVMAGFVCSARHRAMIHWLLGQCRSVESLAFALAFGMVDDKPEVKRSET